MIDTKSTPPIKGQKYGETIAVSYAKPIGEKTTYVMTTRLNRITVVNKEYFHGASSTCAFFLYTYGVFNGLTLPISNMIPTSTKNRIA